MSVQTHKDTRGIWVISTWSWWQLGRLWWRLLNVTQTRVHYAVLSIKRHIKQNKLYFSNLESFHEENILVLANMRDRNRLLKLGIYKQTPHNIRLSFSNRNQLHLTSKRIWKSRKRVNWIKKRVKPFYTFGNFCK